MALFILSRVSFCSLNIHCKTKNILHFHIKCLFCHAPHCLCMYSVMPHEPTQHPSHRPHFTVAALLHQIVGKSRHPFQQLKASPAALQNVSLIVSIDSYSLRKSAADLSASSFNAQYSLYVNGASSVLKITSLSLCSHIHSIFICRASFSCSPLFSEAPAKSFIQPSFQNLPTFAPASAPTRL